MPQANPTPEPTPTPAPAGSCGAPLSASLSSPPLSWQQATSHAASAALAGLATWKAFAWFPACLALVRLPQGGVSHDPWSWLPLLLDLGAVVAIAAPVSFHNFLELVKWLPFTARKPPTP
jgi:hypothetical protein